MRTGRRGSTSTVWSSPTARTVTACDCRRSATKKQSPASPRRSATSWTLATELLGSDPGGVRPLTLDPGQHERPVYAPCLAGLQAEELVDTADIEEFGCGLESGERAIAAPSPTGWIGAPPRADRIQGDVAVRRQQVLLAPDVLRREAMCEDVTVTA